jgi:hypothetical protein
MEPFIGSLERLVLRVLFAAAALVPIVKEIMH